MPPCSQCGKICTEKADDGHYYCNACWQAWIQGLQRERAQLDAKSLAAKMAKDKADKGRAAERAAQEAASKAQSEKRMKEQQEANAREAQEVKERAYWEAYWKLESQKPKTVEPRGENGSRTPVVFWGICDIKYDPRLAARDRLKVLELGDGRSSRFSHDGAPIKARYDKGYQMDSAPFKSQVMVDNKKFTHDTFVECGLGFLRPKQFSSPRRYDSDLAKRIIRDLDVSEDGAVVLKLVNRARGAGVIICPARELDKTLRTLLVPPLNAKLDQWFEGHIPSALNKDRFKDMLSEHKLHYWTNECPLFVVEELRHSVPVTMPETGSDELYDGTLRVAFGLKRIERNQQEHIDIDWLGGYWKLPPVSLSEAASDSLEGMNARFVSSFNTEEKRTAPVDPELLGEVYATLTPALPQIFKNGNVGFRELTNKYSDSLPFRAFAMTRLAASLRNTGEWNRIPGVLEQARRLIKVPASFDPSVLPECSVLSYIERTLGVNCALHDNWAKASTHFNEALRKCPTNASAHYLRGVCLQDQDKFGEAATCCLKAIALDPDFRSPCMALGECWSRMGKYQGAVDACTICLHRQPDAPIAQHIMGQAIYHMLRNGWQGPDMNEADLREKALKCMEIAKSGLSSHWSNSEEEVMKYLRAGKEREQMEVQPLRHAKSVGWRP
mmetsp:Transcript_1966/g.5726  ORF Transcript_1966/g.5726 Transcript_1966/m.5726 type:complete len:669 (+) Transcript_1966:144-2150(+)